MRKTPLSCCFRQQDRGVLSVNTYCGFPGLFSRCNRSVGALLFIAFWVIEPINECIEKRRNKKNNDLYDRRIIYSNNVNNQQNVNNNINRNQLNTEVYQVGSNRVLKENIPQTESNVNQNENNDMKTIPNN